MNRQDICNGHYSEPRARRTTRRPFLIAREAIVRLIMGEVHSSRAHGSHA